MTRLTILLTGILLFTIGLTTYASEEFTKEYNMSYPVNTDALLSMKTQFADINCRVWDKNEVKFEVIVTVYARDERAADKITARIHQGRNVALITDAGTPGVSDPGHYLVKQCLDEAIGVVPIPGPCAATTLLSVSGMEMTRFLFHGFLPPKAGSRDTVLKELTATGFPFVIYESPNRILATLDSLTQISGDRQ